MSIKIGDTFLYQGTPHVTINIDFKSTLDMRYLDNQYKYVDIKILPLEDIQNKEFIACEEINHAEVIRIDEVVFECWEKCIDVPNFKLEKVELYKITSNQK